MAEPGFKNTDLECSFLRVPLTKTQKQNVYILYTISVEFWANFGDKNNQFIGDIKAHQSYFGASITKQYTGEIWLECSLKLWAGAKLLHSFWNNGQFCFSIQTTWWGGVFFIVFLWMHPGVYTINKMESLKHTYNYY